MIEEIKFEPWHLDMIEAQDAQKDVVTSDVGGTAFTLIDGRILACYGAVKIWDGRWMAWAVLSRYAGEKMLSVTRHVKNVMKQADGRLEIIVESDFTEGMRWAKMLGYKMEVERMSKFLNGKDYALFARVL